MVKLQKIGQHSANTQSVILFKPATPISTRIKSVSLLVSAICLAGLYSNFSVAQTETSNVEDEEVVETIVVSAQGRLQSLQDVPISATVFTAEEMESARIGELADYTLASPNVQATNFGNRSRSFLAIRGVTSFGGAVPYGIYVDGLNVVPGRLTRGLDQDLQDIERIEILRGPQGTYFGRNTMAGAINITSIAPQFDDVFGSATVDISSFDTYFGRATINAPLADNFALRAIGFVESTDGFIDNEGDGPGNSSESWGLRTRLRGELSDNLEMNLALSTDRNESDNFNVIPSGVFAPQLGAGVAQINGAINAFSLPLLTFPILPSNGAYPENIDTVSNDLGVNAINETTIASLNFAYTGDNYTVTSITGLVDTQYEEFGEEDFTNLNLITNEENNDMQSLSQEFRLDISVSNTVSVVSGIIWAEDETESFSNRRTVEGNPYNSLPAPFPQLLDTRAIDSSRTFDDTVTSTAVFGELIYVPNENWEMRFGGRYTRDKVDAITQNLLRADDPAIGREETFSAFTPRVAVSYYPNNDATYYATVSSGYKVGGFNFNPNPIVPEGFVEESATNYEVGAKYIFLDGDFSLNFAAFYFDWEDVQVQGFDMDSGFSFIQNAGKAHSQGFELEVSAYLNDNLRFVAGLGWLEAEFDEFENAINSRTGDVIADASGTDIPAAPEWNLSSSLIYEQEFESFMSTWRIDARHVSDHYFSPLNENPVDAYTLVNMSVSANFGKYTLSVYADNVADEEYFVGYKQGIHLSGDQVVVGQPRVVGLRLNVEFE